MSKGHKDSGAQSTHPSDGQVFLNVTDIEHVENKVNTVFVNRDYSIKRFVSIVADQIKMNSFEVDLEFKDFAGQFRYNKIKDDINHVIATQKKLKKEVTDEGNKNYYMMEMCPYQTKKGVEGVLINFVDITELKEAKEELAQKDEKIKNLQLQIIKNDVNERWRIGEYLHDDLGQSMASVKLLLQNLRKKLDNEEKELKNDIDELINVVNRSMKGARDLSHEIAPVDIEKKGISYAFNNFAKQLEQKYGIHCKLEYDETLDKLEDVDLATHLYRIAHEAAKNAVNHGNAENCKITLKSDDKYLYFHIADDGTGFSDDAKEANGLGINIMRNRMELIGGNLEIQNRSEIADTGTTVSCRVPIEKIVESKMKTAD